MDCGIPRIDDLLAGRNTSPLRAGDPDKDAVGVVQDFLIGHGFTGLPGPLSGVSGLFGPQTAECVRAFRKNHGVVDGDEVDRDTMGKLVSVPAAEPIACRGYLTLVLDRSYTGLMKVMALTCQFEGAGRFTASNPNSDGAGLSFGLIQWAQKPGRLGELLRAFNQADRNLFVKIFGAGSSQVADDLVAHTSKPRGGVDEKGNTTDARFDLVAPPWTERFHGAALDPTLQRAQVDTALADFRKSLALIHGYAPELQSERSAAFMLDLANQHGNSGAKQIFLTVQQAVGSQSEAALLLAMENESVGRVTAQYGEGNKNVTSTRNRREAFRTTELLSDGPVPVV